jgi:hypothetical protein
LVETRPTQGSVALHAATPKPLNLTALCARHLCAGAHL